MKCIMMCVFLSCTLSHAVRNPFIFSVNNVAPKTQVIGRGVIHDKHMLCEAHVAADGSIKMRWIQQNVVGKKALQLRTS